MWANIAIVVVTVVVKEVAKAMKDDNCSGR